MAHHRSVVATEEEEVMDLVLEVWLEMVLWFQDLATLLLGAVT